MTIFRLIAVVLAILLLIEIFIFCIWAYISTKNLSLISRYFSGVYSKTGITGLTNPLVRLVQLIYITRMSVITLLILDIFSSIIRVI